MKKTKGFTMIEMIVLIGIIGILVSFFLINFLNSLQKARDKKRIADLEAVAIALELYYDKNGTYKIPDAGYNGHGQGWLTLGNYPPMYLKAVTQALTEQGFLAADDITDPKQGDIGYMIYLCEGQTGNFKAFSLSATLENPTQADINYIQTTCNGVGGNGTYTRYGKNYAIERKHN